MNLFKIIFQPKSILGLLVAVGLLFIFMSGLSLQVSPETSAFFESWGKNILLLGVTGWLLYNIPNLVRLWNK